MKMISVVKYVLVCVTDIIGFLVIMYLFYMEEITGGGLALSLMGLGFFSIFLFNFDQVSKFTAESKYYKVLLALKNELAKVEEAQRDLEIQVAKSIVVKEGASKTDITVRPALLELESVIDHVKTLIGEAEKLLPGKAKAMSGISGPSTIEKKHQA